MLPPIIEQLITIVGLDAVQALLDAHMLGCRVRIGRSRACDWWRDWSEVIGEGAADAVLAVWPGQAIFFPACVAAMRAERNRLIVERFDALVREGASARRAVRLLCRERRMSDRQIEQIINRPVGLQSDSEQQLTLFG